MYTANRLQRWALQLLTYNFTVKYKNTLKFGHADVLSRFISQQQSTDNDVFVIATMNMEDEIKQVLVDAIHKLPVTYKMIKQETVKDKQLQLVSKCLHSDWPSKINENDMKCFYNHRYSLAEKDGILILVDR